MVTSKQSGITLLELMITVAIVGILAGIAYPSYMSYMEQTRRADAQATLVAFAAAMERHFTVNDTYESTVADAGALPSAPLANVFADEAPLDGNDKYYDLWVTAVDVASYSIMATPKGVQFDDPCGNLTLTNTGNRGVTDPDAGYDETDCWN